MPSTSFQEQSITDSPYCSTMGLSSADTVRVPSGDSSRPRCTCPMVIVSISDRRASLRPVQRLASHWPKSHMASGTLMGRRRRRPPPPPSASLPDAEEPASLPLPLPLLSSLLPLPSSPEPPSPSSSSSSPPPYAAARFVMNRSSWRFTPDAPSPREVR